MTPFEGTWKYTKKKNDGEVLEIEYKFEGSDFIYTTSNPNVKEFDGTFVYDDKTITFKVFYLNDEWTQEYNLNDEYLELKQDDKRHVCGRFLKQKS